MYQCTQADRADAALRLLTREMDADVDQHAIQMIASVIEQDELWRHFTYDDDRPLESYAAFVAEVNRCHGGSGDRAAGGSAYASTSHRARHGRLSPRDEARFQEHQNDARFRTKLRQIEANLAAMRG